MPASPGALVATLSVGLENHNHGWIFDIQPGYDGSYFLTVDNLVNIGAVTPPIGKKQIYIKASNPDPEKVDKFILLEVPIAITGLTGAEISDLLYAEPDHNQVGDVLYAKLAGLDDQTTIDAALALKADLVAGKVPANQLPSYVDDVLEYPDFASFPPTGETGKIYVALDTEKLYRWSGSIYIEVSANDVNSVAGKTGIVVLDADDVSETATKKWLSDTDKTQVDKIAGLELTEFQTPGITNKTLPSLMVVNSEVNVTADIPEFDARIGGNDIAYGGGTNVSLPIDVIALPLVNEIVLSYWYMDETGTIKQSATPVNDPNKMAMGFSGIWNNAGVFNFVAGSFIVNSWQFAETTREARNDWEDHAFNYNPIEISFSPGARSLISTIREICAEGVNSTILNDRHCLVIATQSPVPAFADFQKTDPQSVLNVAFGALLAGDYKWDNGGVLTSMLGGTKWYVADVVMNSTGALGLIKPTTEFDNLDDAKQEARLADKDLGTLPVASNAKIIGRMMIKGIFGNGTENANSENWMFFPLADHELHSHIEAVGYGELDTDLRDTLKVTNGNSLDSSDVTITSDGVTIDLNLEKKGTGDIRFLFSDGVYNLDCTPILSIELTAGSDVAPQVNYIYILKSTKALTVSTVGFPASSIEYAPIAQILCQSASSVQTVGPYKSHIWTDHTSNGNGHLAHINAWIRNRPAGWLSGVALNPTAGAAQLDIATGVGKVMQLHQHDFPAFDTNTGSKVYVLNHPDTAYREASDLTLTYVDKDINGVALGDAATDFYNLVIWGVVNEVSGDCKLFCNVPDGAYANNNAGVAENDNDSTAIYTIPKEFLGTGFLIARLTINEAAGTYSVIKHTDLRGQFPSSSVGGGASGLSNLVEDLTPQLGGDLDLNNQDITGDGSIDISKAGVVATHNRTGSDGPVLALKDDGVDAGSVGIYGGDAYIGTGDVGIRFNDSNNLLTPINPTTLAINDAGINIGSAAARFKAAFLSEGVYLGGTTAANLLNKVDRQSFTPTFTNLTIGNGSVWGYYQVINDVCYISCGIIFGSTTVITGDITLASLPEVSANNGTGVYYPINLFMLESGVKLFQGIAPINNNTTSTATLLDTNDSVINATTPFTWGENDVLTFNGGYPIN